jgi:hypothetical protein
MGDIRTSADSTFRDYTTDRVPSSGAREPVKSEVRATFGTVEDRVDDVEAIAQAAVAGVNWTPNTIRVRSTANVVIATALENGDTLNGVTLATGNHVFLGSQTAPAENGLYTVVASGAAARATFADSAAELARIGFVITEGTVGAGERWVLPLAAASITVGTTALAFARVGIEVNYASDVLTLKADMPLTSGELFDGAATTEHGLSNGATVVTTGARSVGLTVPAGQTGINSFLSLVVDVSGIAPELAGQDVRFTLTGTMTAGMLAAHPFIPSNLLTVTDKDDDDLTSQGTNVSLAQVGTAFTRIHDYTFTGEEKVIRLISQIEGTSVTNAAPMTFTLTGAAFALKAAPSNRGTLNDEFLTARIAQQTGRRGYARIITVDASGADYTTVSAALASIIYASPTRRVAIYVNAGSYNEVNLYAKDYVDIIGEDRDTTEIYYELAANTAPATIAAATIVWLNTNSGLFNISLRIKNGRYPLHADGANSEIYRNTQQVVRNVRLTHEGNEDAKAYQATVGGNAGNVWNGTWVDCNGWGGGVCSGQDVVIEDCEFFAPVQPFALHGIDATYVGPDDMPARYTLRRNKFFSTATSGTRYAADFTPEDAPAGCDIILEDNDFTGGLISCPAASDTAARRFRISGAGNTPAAFYLYGGATATRPVFMDEEGLFLNGTGSTLPAKAALAYDAAEHKVRKMTSADAASLFVGIAIANIANGASGRVKTGGAVLLTDILRDDATGVGFGTTFSIGTAGRVVVGGSQGLMFGAASGDRVRLVAP